MNRSMEKNNSKTPQILRMKGGIGDGSYANNSVSQSRCQFGSMPVLERSVAALCCTDLPESVAIADLGCSSGPNALFSVSEIMSIVRRRCSGAGRPEPEFMVFLNDLPGNDFNSVFIELSKMKEENGDKFGSCFVGGVPGSFYGRLFPCKSLHFVHSSSSLHWLSQVPPELSDKGRGKALLKNKGKIFISKTSPTAVLDAYLNQFKKDFSSFLVSRSKEVVGGGGMVLTFKARTQSDPCPDETCLLWDYLAQAFQDLVSQGLIEEEKFESYNTPYYEPYVEDIKVEIEKEGSFTLDCLEIIALPWNGVNRDKDDYDRSRTAQQFAKVTEALARAGLESSNLIVGIDFTKSNEWTGARSYNRRSLHHIGDQPNPYQQAISIIGKTLAAFDDDNLIPCFGFGDASTHDQDVFSFYPDERFCNGFEDVLGRYQEIVPHLRLAGPTSFAPVIEMAMTIVEQSGGQYHVLLIIADGQVTRSVDTEHGKLSPQEQKTIDAIVEASKFPLSIVLVGVGDGPWDMMREFDDNIPSRAFDNFQFVNFTEIMSKNIAQSRKETEFALAALMEIPSQYKATIELNILGGQKGKSPQRVPLPPPVYGTSSFGSSKSFSSSKPSWPSNYEPSVPSFPEVRNPTSTAPPATSSTYDNQLCPICLTNTKDMAFGCGHQTCCECGQDLQTCPICRSAIHTRIKLY